MNSQQSRKKLGKCVVLEANKNVFLKRRHGPHCHMPLIWYSKSMLCYAKSLQSCPTLSDPIDGSPLGSPVPGILQARTLEWVAIFFSNA